MNLSRPYILQPACEPDLYTYCQYRSAPFDKDDKSNRFLVPRVHSFLFLLLQLGFFKILELEINILSEIVADHIHLGFPNMEFFISCGVGKLRRFGKKIQTSRF